MWGSENTAQRICGHGQVCVSLEAGTDESWETHAVDCAGREAGWGTQTFWQKMTHIRKMPSNTARFGAGEPSVIDPAFSVDICDTVSPWGEMCSTHSVRPPGRGVVVTEPRSPLRQDPQLP